MKQYKHVCYFDFDIYYKQCCFCLLIYGQVIIRTFPVKNCNVEGIIAFLEDIFLDSGHPDTLITKSDAKYSSPAFLDYVKRNKINLEQQKPFKPIIEKSARDILKKFSKMIELYPKRRRHV